MNWNINITKKMMLTYTKHRKQKEHQDIVEKLEAKHMVKITEDLRDGYTITIYNEVLINPDGPEAVKEILRLRNLIY